ncbi:MAG TPA: protocatechuate 3,4-dioxygenase subunit alpha [Stellaceae bacterium]|jgi:protocatechuate 3,4-dioxygenase alpha subunit|nr:protocatechuate 3,4-dioxygenase subunit alpha [Stellaceae bacterium]
MADKLIPTPSQTVGPFFHLGLVRVEWADLTADNPAGERIAIEGRVLDGDGAPVPDALIETWQANAAGRYNHPDDRREDKPLDPHFRGFGRVATDAEGRFRLVTIKPGPVPGRGNTLQAPHINIVLFARGLLKHLYTRVYFAGEPANATDPLLSSIEDGAARDSLLARRSISGTSPAIYHFDIVMQGENETAFLDI